MNRKISTQWLIQPIAGCAFGLLLTNSAQALALGEQLQADSLRSQLQSSSLSNSSSPNSSSPNSSATAFQVAIGNLHNDWLISKYHSSNSELQRCLDSLAARDSSVTKRCDAAVQIGQLRAEAQSSALILVSHFSLESDYSVKSAIALALVKISPAVAVQQLLPGIESTDEDYRQLCIAAIFSGGKNVVPPLVKALKCPDPSIRRQSAKALGQLGATAISAVTALKQIATHADENSLFADQAACSAIEIKRDYEEKTGSDIAFNSESWKDEDGRHYRFRMVSDLIESHMLIGLHAAQLQTILGRGVSFCKGSQWRYALGSRGKESLVAYRHNKKEKGSNEKIGDLSRFPTRVTSEDEPEQFLVVRVVDDLVTNCELLTYDPNLWNVTNLDRLVTKTRENVSPQSDTAINSALFTDLPNNLPILAKFTDQIRK